MAQLTEEQLEEINSARQRVAEAEERFGTDAAEVALRLQDLALLLRRYARLLEAVNIEARAKNITERIFVEKRIAHGAPESSEDDLCGTMIGNYQLINILGRGAAGTVYLARHTELAKQVAIKVLRSELLTDGEALSRFEQEARTICSLSHPDIVSLIDYGNVASGEPYLIMDYVEGTTLSSYCEREHPEWNSLLPVYMRLCDALSHAHSKGIIHRDIKPSNILLREENGILTAKLVDFGIASITGNDPKDATLTKTGAVIGSPCYMSPEQCLGYKLDAKSDIYSLGCVIFESICGRKLFDGENAIQIINKQLNEPLAEARKSLLASKMPLLSVNVVLRALQKDPTQRFASANELKAALKDGASRPIKTVEPIRISQKAAGFSILAVCLCIAFSQFSMQKAPSVLGSVVGQGPQYSIKHKETGQIIHTFRAGSLKEALWEATKQKISIEYADLRLADLRAGTMDKVQLPHARLDESNLESASFKFANLTNASIASATCNCAMFAHADLSGTRFDHSHFYNAMLDFAHGDRVSFIKCEMQKARLNYAKLLNANFDGAQLTDAWLNGADLRGASMIEANLSGAQLDGADLRQADLRNCNFQGANLMNADLTDAVVTDANFDGAELRDAKMPLGKINAQL